MNIVKLLRQGTVSGTAASSLLNGLVAYWKLDETSGTRFDSAGTNHLTDNGSVGSTIGKQGNAASFSGSNLLRITSNPVVQLNSGSYSIACWFRPGSDVSAFQNVLAKAGSGFPTLEYNLSILSGNIRFVVGDGGGSLAWLVQRPIVANTWYFAAATFDGTTASLSLNAGTPATQTLAAVPYVGTADFRIGARDDGVSPAYFTGDVDEVGLWDRVLTDGTGGDVALLYNSGAGLTFPFT